MTFVKITRILKAQMKLIEVPARMQHSTTIPGPKYYPFLGPLNEIITMGKAENLHLTVDNYHRKYGPVFKVKMGPTNGVFISSADDMRNVFLNEGKYPKNFVPPAWTYFNKKHNMKRGLLFMQDSEWYHHRNILNQFLLKDFQWCENLIQLTSDNFVTKIKRHVNSETDVAIENLEDEIYLWSIYLIINMMLGSPVSEQSDRSFDAKVWDAVKSFQTIMKTSAKLMSLPTELADKFHLSSYKQFEEANFKCFDLCKSLIQIINDEMKVSETGLFWKLKTASLSDEIIVRLFSDLLIAATDTSAKSTQWYLHTVARDEILQRRLRKSIIEKPQDLETPLIKACLREVLRLYPIAPFLCRLLHSDTAIGGYLIPKGSLAIISLYTSGRSPENFSDPLVFAPDRWLRGENDTNYKVFKTHATIPFALGARSCIGRKIANYGIHCLMTKMLQEFSLKSLNTTDVGFKLELVGVPDQKIMIACRKAE